MHKNPEIPGSSVEEDSQQFENLEQKDIQIEVTEMPDGTILYSAEDGENLVQVFASTEKGNKVMIAGHETNDPEEIEKVGEIFGMDPTDPNMANPSSVNKATSSAIKNETGQVERELRQALQQEGVVITDEMFKRRMGQMTEGMSKELPKDSSAQQMIDFMRNSEEIDKVKKASLAEAIGRDSAMVNALANRIPDPSAAAKFRQRAYEMQQNVGGVVGAENDNSSVQEFGKAIEEAMSLAGVDDIKEIEQDAENDKSEKKAA